MPFSLLLRSMLQQQSVWVSNSSISDYQKCHRAYYLKNIYKDPKTRHKIGLINPSLVLGQVVHLVLEALSEIRCEERFSQPLTQQFEREWEKFHGEKGGFRSDQEEEEWKKRGLEMIQRVMKNPGPLSKKAIKLRSADELPPRYTLSEEHQIIVCGKIDWLEYIPQDDSVHIIDFKTGKHEENVHSLQLPIYALLVNRLQKRKTKKMSYWYLDRDNEIAEMPVPDIQKAHERVLTLALEIKQLRTKAVFTCERFGGCFACKPYELILNGQAKFLGSSGYQDIYSLS